VKKTIIIIIVLVLLAVLFMGLYYFLWTGSTFSALADYAERNGHQEIAVKLYEKAAKLSPDNEAYSLLLADTYVKHEEYSKAERVLVTSIRTEPKLSLYQALSKVYYKQDKLMDIQQLLDGVTDPQIARELEKLRPTVPTVSPESGTYSELLSFTVQSDFPVYYSTTREYPSLNKSKYDEPFLLPNGNTMISLIAVDESSGLVSKYVSYEYLINGVVEPVSFEDSELESIIRSQLYIANSSHVLTSDLWAITELTIPQNITTYSDLKYFVNLESLTITSGKSSDLSFLTYLPALKTLCITDTVITSEALDYIGMSTSLESLTISNCSISNLLPLSNLTSLIYLDISENSISNLSVLSNFTKLAALDAHTNAINNVSVLSSLTSLKTIDLSNNIIDSIDAFSKLTALESLNISHNQLSSIDALRSISSLLSLDAANNNISSISCLVNCLGLTRIDVSDNKLENVPVLQYLLKLEYVDISHNAIIELPEISSTAAYVEFYAQYNNISDISTLNNMQHLVYLNIDYNELISDIECLSGCTTIVQIDCFGTQVRDVSLLTDVGVIVNYNPYAFDIPDVTEETTEN